MPDLVVPALGESITEAVISRWHKQIGDPVEADEPVLALETDKITVDLPAPSSGALTEQRFAEGDTVKVGDVVGIIGAAGAAKPAARPAASAAAAPASPARQAEARPTGGASAEARPPSQTEARPAAPEAGGGNGSPAAARPLSPSMRRARLEGEAPVGSADGGGGKAASPAASPGTQAPARPAVSTPGGAARAPGPAGGRQEATEETTEETIKMSPIRKRIAERLVEAQRETASLTTFNEVDMSAVIALRERYKQEFTERHGVKLGFMSFFAKACVSALELFPGVNAEVRGDSIVYKKHYDLGVAVSTERGLVVPVLRGVDRLSFAGIEKGLAELATRARNGKLALDDLIGGTFSITNGGIYGSMLSTPLLNYPQTGILGMHNIVERPIAVNGVVEVRPVMYLALTYDHRVVDGKEAVSFLVAVKQRIEQPDRLMFEL